MSLCTLFTVNKDGMLLDDAVFEKRFYYCAATVPQTQLKCSECMTAQVLKTHTMPLISVSFPCTLERVQYPFCCLKIWNTSHQPLLQYYYIITLHYLHARRYQSISLAINIANLSISELPCTLQLERTMSAQLNALLTKELISTSKIMMGWVYETVATRTTAGSLQEC